VRPFAQNTAEGSKIQLITLSNCSVHAAAGWPATHDVNPLPRYQRRHACEAPAASPSSNNSQSKLRPQRCIAAVRAFLLHPHSARYHLCLRIHSLVRIIIVGPAILPIFLGFERLYQWVEVGLLMGHILQVLNPLI